MNILKPLLSINEGKTFGNLSDSNQGLIIEVSNLHGPVSSLSQVSIKNKKQLSTTFSTQNSQTKLVEYTQSSIKKLQNDMSTIPKILSSPEISIPRSSTKIANSSPLLPRTSQTSSNISQQIQKPKIQVTKKSNYWQIIEQCKKNNIQFTDTEFPPNQNSLGSSNYVKRQTNYGGWKRISEIIKSPIFVKKYEAEDALQGQIGDCYFLSSIASIAKDYPHLFEKIFISQQLNKYGIYMAKFYVEGILVEVVVDDYIPVTKNNTCLYAKSTIDNQIWTILLQKCWAKLFKSYQRIQSGSPQEVFYALTGSPYGVKIAQNLSREQKLQQFKKLYRFKQKGSLFSCNTLSSITEKQKLTKKGLVAFHAYSVLQLYIDPICIVKLRNPWGYNKGCNQVNGYYYDWKTKMIQFYKENASKYLNILKQKKIDLFRPQTDGQFYMHYDQFMTDFQSITICPINNSLNLLSLRSTFVKNKGKFFYFDLTQQSQLIVSMSQMFKKMEDKFEQQNGYAVTTLILAKIIKKDGRNSRVKQKLSSNQSQSDVSIRIPKQNKIFSSLSQKLNSKFSQNQSDQVVEYEFIAARSNNAQSPFNFLTIDQKIFQPGRYIIYSSANIKTSLMKKNCSITVHSVDTSFPKQLNDLEELFIQKGSNSILKSLNIFKNNDDLQKKWLQQVFLDKAINDKQNMKFLNQFPKQNQQNLTNQELDKILNQKISLQNSWYSYSVPSLKYYQKMGGFGYFVCHLPEKNETIQKFLFKQKQYNARCIEIISSSQNATRQNDNIALTIKPGQIKILVFRLYRPADLKETETLFLKYPHIDPIDTSPSLPIRISENISKIKSSENLPSFTATSLFSEFLN